MEVRNVLKSSDLKIQDLIDEQLNVKQGKPSELLIDDHDQDQTPDSTHDGANQSFVPQSSQQDPPTVKGQESNMNYGNYEIKKQQINVKSPTVAKKSSKVNQKYVKKVDIKVSPQKALQELNKGSKSNSKAQLSHRVRPLSQKSKKFQDHSYSSDQHTEQISPSKHHETSDESIDSYGMNGVDEVRINEKPQSSLSKSHPTKKNTSVQISRQPTDYYIGKIKYHSKLPREKSIENIHIQENNTSAQVTTNDLLMENRQSTERLNTVMQRLNPKSNQMIYLQQSQPNLVSLDNQFGLIHSTAQNKKLAQKVNNHFQNIYTTQKYYKEAKRSGVGIQPAKKREYGSYIEKFLDYQSRHNLRNPMTKLKVLNSQSKNAMRFNTHLGGSTIKVVFEGAQASINIPVGQSSGEQVSIGTSSSVLELMNREKRTRDLSRELRESISMDSFHEDIPGHLVQLNETGLKISTHNQLDRETSRSMLTKIRQPSKISLNNHQFHMKRDSQNLNSVISSHNNALHQKQMNLLRDPSKSKNVKKLRNTNKGISQIYDSKVQKLNEKLNTLEEEIESNLDVDHNYMVQVMTHDEPEHQMSNAQMTIQVQQQKSPQSFGGIHTHYNQGTKNEQNFFKSNDGNSSNYGSPKKVAISLLKNENLNVIKHQKQSLGENYDDMYNESPSFTKTASQKMIGSKKTRNGSAANSRDDDQGMIVINSKNYTQNISHMHSTRRNSQIDIKQVRNNSINSGANSNVTEKDKKERADGFSAYIAEQQQLAEMNQIKDYNSKLQIQYEENKQKLQNYHQNLKAKKVVLDINKGIISQSMSHGDSRGSLHDDGANDMFKPQLNHQYNIINFGGDQSQTENVSRANETANQSRGSKDDISTIIGTPKPLNNKHPVNRKIKDEQRKNTPIKVNSQVDAEYLASQESLINIMDSSQHFQQQPPTTRNKQSVETGKSLAPVASNKSILKLQELLVNVKKPISNKNSMAIESSGQPQNSDTRSQNEKRTQGTPISKGTGYVLNSSGPSLVRQSNKQSVESLIIRQNNVNTDSSPFIKIDVQTRQQKKVQKNEKALSKEMKEMKFHIQGGVQIIVSPDTNEQIIDSNRNSNKSPSQKNLNPNKRKLEQMMGSNNLLNERPKGRQFIVKGQNKSSIRQQSQGIDNPEHDEHFADINLALSSVDSAHKYTHQSGTTLRPTLSKAVHERESSTSFLNTLSQNVFLQPRHNSGIIDQNLQMQSPNGVNKFEGIPYKGMRGSVTNKNIKNFKSMLRKQQNQLQQIDTNGLPTFGAKQMGLEGIPLSPSLKPIMQTQFQTPQMFSPSVLVTQVKHSHLNSQGTQVTQIPARANSKKKIFSRVNRDHLDTHHSDVKVQTNRINEIVQRRNSQSVFQTQQKLDATNKTLAQMQSLKDNMDMSSVYQSAKRGGSLMRNSRTKRSNNPSRLPNIYNLNIEQNIQEMELQRHKTMLEQYASQNQEWSQNLGNGAIPNQTNKNSPQRQNEINQMASLRQSHESQQKRFNQENSNINPQELMVLNIQKMNQMQRNDPNRSSIGQINQDLEDSLNHQRNKHSHKVSVPRVRVEKQISRPWREEVQLKVSPKNSQPQIIKSPKPQPQYGDIHFQAGAGAQTGSSIDHVMPLQIQNQRQLQKPNSLSLNIVPARSEAVENQTFQKDGGVQPWGNVTHQSPKPAPRVQHQKSKTFKIRKIEASDPNALGVYSGHEHGPAGVTSQHAIQEESTIVIGSQIASTRVQSQYEANLMRKHSSLDSSSVAAGAQEIKSMESQKQTIEIQIQN